MRRAFAARVATTVLLVGSLTHVAPLSAQAIDVPFDPPRWTLDAPRAEFVEHLGRHSLRLAGGSATLKDVQLQDGTIEVDVSGTKSGFAFLFFRAATPKDREDVYLRMAASGTPDALQYMPTFGGQGSWQLYHGPGYTANVAFDVATWTHLRVVVEGRHATVFVGDATNPAMVSELQGGGGPGAIGLLEGTPGGFPEGVLFSNFRYTPRTPVVVPTLTAPAPSTRPGTIRDWSLSTAVSVERTPLDTLPTIAGTARKKWLPVQADPNGVLNIARYRTMAGPLSLVVAHTTIRADRDEVRRLVFGYSDDVTIFLNGRPLYAGRNGFRARYPSAAGLMTPDDAVYLPLRRGANELVFVVTEAFGGWGLEARLDRPAAASVP